MGTSSPGVPVCTLQLHWQQSRADPSASEAWQEVDGYPLVRIQRREYERTVAAARPSSIPAHGMRVTLEPDPRQYIG